MCSALGNHTPNSTGNPLFRQSKILLRLPAPMAAEWAHMSELSAKMLRQITEMFERLVSELPPGTAAVNLKPVQKGVGTFVEIVSANPESADFRVHCDESDFFKD